MAWRRVQATEEGVPSHLETWQEELAIQGGGGTPYNSEIPMAVDICYFVDGVHYPGEWCPHDSEEYPLGWTV